MVDFFPTIFIFHTVFHTLVVPTCIVLIMLHMGCFTSTACIWLTEPTRPLSLLAKFFGCYLVFKLVTGAAVEHRSVYDPSQWVYGCLLSQSMWCGVLAWWLAGSLSTAVMAEHSQQSSQEQTAATQLRKPDQGRLWNREWRHMCWKAQLSPLGSAIVVT